jgi:ParB family chromosome partitioning protein
VRRALGRGLSQLLADQHEAGAHDLPLSAIRANATQPRTQFDVESLEELAESIRQVGVLSPILVRPVGEGAYEIIAGERRYRAAKQAGLEQIPVIVRAANAQSTLEMAIIENVQRVDIGAIEAAEAYDRLIKDFGMTQEEVALKVGKSRSAVANLLRLLKLTEEARQALMNGRITEGHARALLLAKSNDQQLDWLERVLTEGLNVRQTEALAKVGEKPLINQAPVQPEQTPNPVAEALREHLMAPVRIESGAKRGKIVIEFFGEDDLTRIFDRLGIEVR